MITMMIGAALNVVLDPIFSYSFLIWAYRVQLRHSGEYVCGYDMGAIALLQQKLHTPHTPTLL